MSRLNDLIKEYRELGISDQLDYNKLYLYSIITHSTAIEGSTVTEIENQLLFDEGISSGKPMVEQLMNLDLKAAYENGFKKAEEHQPVTVELLCELSGLVMKNTGSVYNTIAGTFSSADGELRLLNVSAGRGGHSYMAWQKVPGRLKDFCEWIYKACEAIGSLNEEEIYRISFEAHYRLVHIHPWADGNGRMSRLLMNMLQYEAGVIPSIVKKESRIQYIQSLADTREEDDVSIFIDFMLDHHIQNIEQQIEDFKKSLYDQESDSQHRSGGLPRNFPETSANIPEHVKGTIDAIGQNPGATNKELGDMLGVSDRTIRTHIRVLKELGLIERIGSDRSGCWKIINA